MKAVLSQDLAEGIIFCFAKFSTQAIPHDDQLALPLLVQAAEEPDEIDRRGVVRLQFKIHLHTIRIRRPHHRRENRDSIMSIPVCQDGCLVLRSPCSPDQRLQLKPALVDQHHASSAFSPPF